MRRTKQKSAQKLTHVRYLWVGATRSLILHSLALVLGLWLASRSVPTIYPRTPFRGFDVSLSGSGAKGASPGEKKGMSQKAHPLRNIPLSKLGINP
ncbi:MAG: hypothetical protein ACXWP5_10480, partial [Bdellovibrionota bacterium]